MASKYVKRTWSRALYRHLRHIILSLPKFKDNESLIHFLLKNLVDASRKHKGHILGGRAYVRNNGVYKLFSKYGEAGPVQLGYEVPLTYRPIQKAIEQGWVFVRESDPDFDPSIEAPIGASAFAAIALGQHNEYLLSFSLSPSTDEDEMIYALVSIRQVAEMVARERAMSSFIREANEIQTSLLPKEPPRNYPYDIAFRSRPALFIGGDIYDFIPISDTILGICIGDATGHGFPAALQARDVIIGLRMGAEENLKIIRTIEKLHRVVSQSSLTSRFISVFYGEIEDNGNLVFVNAGHIPPIILRAKTGQPIILPTLGPAIGLPVEGRFHRAFERLDPGDILVMYTDGITDARNPEGEEFGIERLIEIIQKHKDKNAQEIVDIFFKKLDEFKGLTPQEDDQTLVIVKRLNTEPDKE